MSCKSEFSPKSPCSDFAERKHSISPHNNPKVLSRACESCRARKVRCLPEDPTKCQRCARSGRPCVYTAPEKRRRRKRTDTRVAELEHMVQMLAARLEEEQRARLEQGQEKRQETPKDVLNRPSSRSASVIDHEPSSEESTYLGSAQRVDSPMDLTSSLQQTAVLPASVVTIQGSDAAVSCHQPIPSSHQHHSPNPPTQPFVPSPSLDYTKRSSIPPSLRTVSWPTPDAYLGPSLRQSLPNWQDELSPSPHPSPSQSASLASTVASPQSEMWPSPEQDFASLYPESYFYENETAVGAGDKINAYADIQDAASSTWWMTADGVMADQAGYFDAGGPCAHAFAIGMQSQQWGFLGTEMS